MEEAAVIAPKGTVRAQRYLYSSYPGVSNVVQIFVPADATRGRECFVFQHNGAYFVDWLPSVSPGVYPTRVGDVEEVDVPVELVDIAYASANAQRVLDNTRHTLSCCVTAKTDPVGIVAATHAHRLAEITAGRQHHHKDMTEMYDRRPLGVLFSLGFPAHELVRFTDGREQIITTYDEYSEVQRRETRAACSRRGEPLSDDDE